MVFAGPALVGDIKRGLCDYMSANNIAGVAMMTGTKAGDWPRKRL